MEDQTKSCCFEVIEYLAFSLYFFSTECYFILRLFFLFDGGVGLMDMLQLKKRLLRSEEKRVALRQGVSVLSLEVDRIQEENLQLKNGKIYFDSLPFSSSPLRLSRFPVLTPLMSLFLS